MKSISTFNDGDYLKILPMLDNDDNIIWFRSYDCVFLKGKVIYDNSDKKYLRKIVANVKKSHPLFMPNFAGIGSTELNISQRHFVNFYENGKIDVLSFPTGLMRILNEDTSFIDIRSNKHILISKTNVGGFVDYSNSKIWDKKWTPPVLDINSEKEWIYYLKNNKTDIDTHINNNSIFKRKDILIDVYGKDFLADIISKDRDNKIDEILYIESEISKIL